MVRYERVAKRVKHDKAEKRAQRRHKEQCSDLDTSAKKAPTKINRDGKSSGNDQP